ncbi:hypothetical protein R5R35_008050 [Gryllus longicercus]|uniref:Accessory gland protein n=1 Tax=Gryllus longicercus TaxID=2509291 RepID=A0AAN9ZBN7_9ORTH
MAARALCFIVALSVFQAPHALSIGSVFNLTAAVNSLTNVVDTLKNTAESTLNSTLEGISSEVNAVVSRLETNLTSTIAEVSSEVQQLVQEAKNEGIAVGSCGVTASVNLTKIYAGLPVSLAHCYLDYLDAFNYYVDNVEKDISASYQAIKDAVSAATKCGFFDLLLCETNVFLNATNFERKKAEDVAFQLLNSGTAAVNLVATITLCDEEKSTQAVLDVYNVIPATKKCLAAKKAELSNSSDSS